MTSLDPKIRADLDKEAAFYEQRFLQAAAPPQVSLEKILSGLEFIRLSKISNFWDKYEHESFWSIINDLTIAAHSHGDYLTFVIAGKPSKVEIYYSLGRTVDVKDLLAAHFAGAEFVQIAAESLPKHLASNLTHGGMLSGIPSLPLKALGAAPVDIHGLERIVRGMRNETWLYIVQAYPLKADDIPNDRQVLLDKMSNIAAIARLQIQQSIQRGTSRESETVSEAHSTELLNRPAEYVLGLLENELERLEKAFAVGRWNVAIFYGAAHKEKAARLGSLLKGLFGGPDSRPQPLRIHPFQGSSTSKVDDFHTILSSEELAMFIPVLREEVPGYAVKDWVQFDCDYPEQGDGYLSIGSILWEDQDTKVKYQVSRDGLTKHGVVFGVTGTGKTTSIFNLLDQTFKKMGTPFLVIEPAKTEYRALLGRINNQAGTGPIPDLRIYTLGEDTIAPFRINPFEFEVDSSSSAAPVLSHIDYLKAVFNAAFILYAPMPYILETALHEIYVDKGWNLAMGTNLRLGLSGWKNIADFPIFPTLTDLYNKVEPVTKRLGYEKRIEQDVVAGLKARIGALRLGAKGLMLDTARGNSIEALLSHPTVLEMENIGNDDEKTFLMGLILARIYSFRRLKAAAGLNKEGLVHLLVIEEAHRLLKNTSTRVEVEASNLQAQAIETFINMLSEIRHYGQGVLVAEQIPSKLTPDVIKNTNLKIIHRLLAEDDRNQVGHSMNMTDEQIRYLTTLPAGKSVVFSEGDDHPYLLQMLDYKKEKRMKASNNAQLRSYAEKYISLKDYFAQQEFEDYGIPAITFSRPDPIIYQWASERLGDPELVNFWAYFIVRVIYNRQATGSLLVALSRLILSRAGYIKAGTLTHAMNLVILLGVSEVVEARARVRGWDFSETEEMRKALAMGLILQNKGGNPSASASQLDRFVRKFTAALERDEGPYPGCVACRAVCQYHEEIRALLRPIHLHHIRQPLASEEFDLNDLEKYRPLTAVLFGIIKQWLDGESPESEDLAYCLGVTSLARLGFNDYDQTMIGEVLAGLLIDKS